MIAIVISCDRVAREAGRIVSVCHKIQEKLPQSSWERNEIFKLLTLVNSKKALYTAADYFIVSRSTLFGLLSVTTTYFIILVQFNQSL